MLNLEGTGLEFFENWTRIFDHWTKIFSNWLIPLMSY
jgi:hypothetical protein